MIQILLVFDLEAEEELDGYQYQHAR